MVMHRKSFSVDINDELSESFSTQCDERGYTKYRALEGAIRAFLVIPPEAQVALMSNVKNHRGLLIKIFADIALEEDLQKISPTQRNQILALAKEAAKTISRKK